MSKPIPLSAVHEALKLLGIDDHDNVRNVEISYRHIIVNRIWRDDEGRAKKDEHDRLMCTEETHFIEWPPVSADEPLAPPPVVEHHQI